METYSLAFSPCPNDTFMFHKLVSQRSGGAGTGNRWRLDVNIHDVETLNRMAFENAFDITKLSFHAWLLVRGKYALLNSGAAMGFGCGPVIVSKEKTSPEKLAACRIAVPGELTTAHLLLQLFAPQVRDKVFTRYDKIMEAVTGGEADCGVLIHEGRFVFERFGLCKVVDLGEWWEEQTGLPIPLGGVCIKKDTAPGFIEEFDRLLAKSITAAMRDPAPAISYARNFAQELDDDVLRSHIAAFVNDYSTGRLEVCTKAVEKLEAMAVDAGIIK